MCSIWINLRVHKNDKTPPGFLGSLGGVFEPCCQIASKLAPCHGIRRIVPCLNMLFRVRAPDEQYLATVQHGSKLTRKFSIKVIFHLRHYQVTILGVEHLGGDAPGLSVVEEIRYQFAVGVNLSHIAGEMNLHKSF